MIELHQYPAVWGLSSLSPFCIKVEAFLRAAGLPYRVVVERNPARGPNGKMPFLREGARVVADSTFILDHLVRGHGLGRFEAEDPALRATSLAFQRLIEENLYFVLLYSRWVDPAGWSMIQREFLPLFPPLVGRAALALIRRSLQRQAWEQGIGRHSLEGVYAIGRRDLGALSDYLAGKAFFLGDRFTTIDASLFAFLVTILKQPLEGELQKALKERENLVRYCERLEAGFASFTVHNAENRV